MKLTCADNYLYQFHKIEVAKCFHAKLDLLFISKNIVFLFHMSDFKIVLKTMARFKSETFLISLKSYMLRL
jgi:hypothetical protein